MKCTNQTHGGTPRAYDAGCRCPEALLAGAQYRWADRQRLPRQGKLNPVADLETWISLDPYRQRAAAQPGKYSHAAIQERARNLRRADARRIEDALQQDRVLARMAAAA